MRKFGVVLADDEFLICSLLQKIIEWDQLELECLGVANDGTELRHLIEEQHPDIVITDICMPDQNGIELIRDIRKLNIPCRFIVISGYRQFEYARNAVRYDVDDYILKPVDAQELNSALRRIAESLREGHEAIRDDGTLLNESAGYRHYINRLLSGAEGAPDELSDMHRFNEKYNTSFSAQVFRFACVRLDIPNDPLTDSNDNSAGIASTIAQTILGGIGSSCTYAFVDTAVDRINLLLNYNSDVEHKLLNALHDSYKASLHVSDLFIGMRSTLALGSRKMSFSECPVSYRETQIVLATRLIHPNEAILKYESIETMLPVSADQAQKDTTRNILQCVEQLDPNRLSSTLTALIGGLRNDLDVLRLMNMLNDLSKPIAAMIAPKFESPLDESYLESELLQALDSSYSIDTLRTYYFELVCNYVRKLRNEAEQKQKRPIRQALEYINKNYAQSLRLEEVAAKVYLSPNYFSEQFTKENGISFTDYILNLRIEAAKRLLIDTNKSISEIAMEVGYTDARYFSKLFAKQIGLIPKEYRKLYG